MIKFYCFLPFFRRFFSTSYWKTSFLDPTKPLQPGDFSESATSPTHRSSSVDVFNVGGRRFLQKVFFVFKEKPKGRRKKALVDWELWLSTSSGLFFLEFL